jgi:hypothetical protein
MTRKPLKTIRSHAGYARLLGSADLERDPNDPDMPLVVRTIPRPDDIPSPYWFAHEWDVYRWKGRDVVIRETSHRCYQVFDVQPIEEVNP